MTTLITGASGHLGSDVLDFLLKWNGPTNLIATSRKADNSTAIQEKGVQFRLVDFDIPETLSAFDGVEKLFLISTDSFDEDGRFQSQKRAIDAAVTAKVAHLYYTSGVWGGYGNSKVSIQQAHLRTEEYLKKSGLTYTIIREGLYAEGITRFMSYTPDSTEVVLPADGPAAWAKRSELAEGTAHILQAPSSKFANQTILLSGASTTSLTECAGIISKLKGKDLPVRRVTNDEYIKETLAFGVNEFLANLMVEIYTALENGECATVAPTLEELLGRQPKSVEDFLRETLV